MTTIITTFLNILEALKGLMTANINMPIAFLGKVEQHNYYNPIIVLDKESGGRIAQDAQSRADEVAKMSVETLTRLQRPVIEAQPTETKS